VDKGRDEVDRRKTVGGGRGGGRKYIHFKGGAKKKKTEKDGKGEGRGGGGDLGVGWR